jgi:hypothetical protein
MKRTAPTQDGEDKKAGQRQRTNFHFADLSILSSRTIFLLEDQRGTEETQCATGHGLNPKGEKIRGIQVQKQKRLQFRKTGMKAFDESRRKQIGRLASSFSLRRSAPKGSGADERNQTGILTLASDLFPPSRSCEQWHWEL